MISLLEEGLKFSIIKDQMPEELQSNHGNRRRHPRFRRMRDLQARYGEHTLQPVERAHSGAEACPQPGH